MNKVIIPSVTLAVLLIIGAIQASDISAHSYFELEQDELVREIANEFDLSEDDIQAVIDAVYDEHIEYMSNAGVQNLIEENGFDHYEGQRVYKLLTKVS